MLQTGLPLLISWQSFFMLIGTAAATLTGLMFIVITLIAGIDVHVPTINAGISAFTTPTVVHFCSVLLLAAILSAPWQAFVSVSLALGLLGLGEVIYLLRVANQMRHMPDYQTPLRDWVWYSVTPIAAYSVLIIAAVVLTANPALALFMICAVMTLLLFIGIRNAWDLLVYLAVDRAHQDNKRQD